jgi:hypothetical protein
MTMGGCACGLVRFVVRGQPLRVGLCHCLTCRKYHGSAFNPFVIFRQRDVKITGVCVEWRSSSTGVRKRCAICGSPIAYVQEGSGEIELSLGSFDQTSIFMPQYENWISRRELWQHPVAGPQNLAG